MQRFKKLASNIFFKIFIGFLILSFAFFGVSNFLLNSSGSWVAKVGDKTISYAKLSKVMQNEREAILRANPQNAQALQYVESPQFKSDTLGRLINKIIFDKLQSHYGIEASRRLILEAVAKNQNFIREGKFDHIAFKSFLAQNGLNEETYVKAVQDELLGSMIVKPISLASPVDEKFVEQIVNLKEEKRLADVITISDKNLAAVAAPSSMELNEYFEKNKQKFVTTELRNISYISVDKKSLESGFTVGETDIAKEYENNKEKYQTAERRNFYHLLFSEKKSAQDFLSALEITGGKDKAKTFIELAKKIAGKNLKEISLQNVTKKDLIPELSANAFSLTKNAVSAVLPSPLGFHIFLLNEVKNSEVTPLAEVKNSIKQNLLRSKSEEALQQKITAIEDSLLATNSLNETAKKFAIKTINNIGKINEKGQNENGATVSSINALEGFVKNAFTLKNNEVSKLYFSQNNNIFYAIKVEAIEPVRAKKFDEVKAEIASAFVKEKRTEQLRELANKISLAINQKPSEALQISAKNGFKVEKNREFPRFYYLEFQGKKVPYSSKFLEELFAAKIGQTTSASMVNAQEFNIGILREVKKANITKNQVALGKAELSKNYKTEFLEEFNNFLQKKYPIKINEKIFGEEKSGEL